MFKINRSGSRITLLFLAFLALQLLSGVAHSSCGTLTLVSSNSHFSIVHRIEAFLFAQGNQRKKLVHVLAESVKDPDYFDKHSDTCLIVTIGSEALASTLKTKTQLPILGVLIRKNMFMHLLRQHDRRLDDPKRPISAILLDQPLSRQLELIQNILPQQPKLQIGVLLGSQSLDDHAALQSVIHQKELALTTIYVNKYENPVAVLDGLLDEAKVVLALPDSRIYNPKTARGILLTAFHKRIPLFAYSRTFVNNGALAAVYTTSKQIAQQTAQEIVLILQKPDLHLPPLSYPKEFTVAVNYQVASSLGIAIDSEAALKTAIIKKQNQTHDA